jgi:hypothetical protein
MKINRHEALVTAFFLSCASVFHSTILVSVSESVDGEPAAPPPPAMEGGLDSLFEAGHIVFVTGDVAAPLPTVRAEMALFETAGEKMVGSKTLDDDNRGRENEVNPREPGFRLGSSERRRT